MNGTTGRVRAHPEKGSYFEDSAANYARGIAGFAGQYSEGDTHITVHVAQGNATPREISAAVQDAIKQSNTRRDFITAMAAGTGQ